VRAGESADHVLHIPNCTVRHTFGKKLHTVLIVNTFSVVIMLSTTSSVVHILISALIKKIF
jgi:hypothetical protein